ncbi:MAG: S41 family peptidase [Candidatus Omnitrophica bacterium]|nr:S41 family peptidase [Candidatus Omnitrophota bacterium]
MRKRIVAVAIVVIALCSSYLTGFSLGKEKDAFYKELDIFAEALAVIDKKGAETKDPHQLMYGAMAGLLGSVDSYSEFLTPEDYKDLLTETAGHFGGLGLDITTRGGLLTVIAPLEDTPASRAGIKPGDIIVKIEGKLTKGIGASEAVAQLRGEPGTKITISVLRDKTKKVEDITLTRAIIKIKDITRSVILEDGIGYAKIAEFREATAKDLALALAALKQAGLKGLVLDVRNNPGGLLDSAVEVTSLFLEDGKTVVSTQSRSEKEFVYKATSGHDKYLNIPMVILINKGSASGSEIVAAALREHARAILVGETTFGKGSVQSVVPLSDGSALRLTTATYYTPKGTSIHEKGVNPDIVVSEEDNKNGKRAQDVVVDTVEGKKDTFDYKKDVQIVRALDLIRGLLVLSSADKR